MKGFNMNNIEGIDDSVEISLGEYGMAWILSDDKKEYIFYYGVENDEEGNYSLFDWGTINSDTDVHSEYGFIDQGFFDYIDQSLEDWDKSHITQKMFDLKQYYGYENIFGTSYYSRVAYNANINRFQNIKEK